MSTILSWLAFSLGGLLCLANFYLSFLRYPLHRFRGLPKESYHWVSGFPLVGSFFVALSLLVLHGLPGILFVAIVLISIDTGGIHWFFGTMIYRSVYDKKNS